MTAEELKIILAKHALWLADKTGKFNEERANLRHADLRHANLHCADLHCADLRYANLSGTKGIKMGFACPDTGTFIAWKKAQSVDSEHTKVIVKLKIPEDARRSSATTNKCRADKAEVLEIETLEGKQLPDDFIASSFYDPDFFYMKGNMLEVKEFSTNRWDECGPGIYFFINRIDAINY